MNLFNELIQKKDIEKIKEFGISLISNDFYKKLKDLHYLFRRRFIIGHRDFDKVLNKNFVIVSGRGPSADIHIVHIILFSFIRDLQDKLGVNVFIPVSDDEKFLFGKASYEDTKKYAIDNIVKILALGFNPKRTKIFIDTFHMNPTFYDLAVRVAKKITFNVVRATFGLNESSNIGSIFYPSIQIVHILLPTFLDGKQVLVPIGIDQDPFIRLSRDIAEELRIYKPASIYLRTIRGLRGEEKMSASQKETSIFISESNKEIKRKVYRALTGGRETLELQKKFGGIPEKCPVFEYISLIEKDDKKVRKIYEDCKSGNRMCGECKEYLYKKILELKKKIENNLEKVKNNLDKFVWRGEDRLFE